MNLLGVKQNSASKPSLFSSLWSVQVQHQNDASDSLCREDISGKSICDLNVREIPVSGRNALSLYELNSSLLKVSLKRAATCPSFFPGIPDQSIEDVISKCSLGISIAVPLDQCAQRTDITRQQKNRNICEWLRKISAAEPLSETSSVSSMNDQSSFKKN